MRTYSILFVEDDEISYPVVTSVVKEVFDTIPDIVETGTEALRAVEAKAYDLILMDLALLESDGFRITQAIRERTDSKRDIVIVAVTAYFTEAVEKICFKIGMNDIIDKPFTVEKCQAIKEKFFESVNEKS